jgi:metal-sulfur cluster biosynthetic enzyme
MLRGDAHVTPGSGSGVTEAQVYDAIAEVLDPELDQSLVKLGFIDHVEVLGPDVTVVFKLPTYWCAPNFAYLMAADLQKKVRAVPGVRESRVVLLDHFAEDEITSGVNKGQSFPEAFPGEALEDLDELRRTFACKGFLMRQEVLLRRLMKAGLDEPAIIALRVADLTIDESADAAIITSQGSSILLPGAGRIAELYLRKGAALGLPQAPDDPLIIDTEGRPIPSGGLPEFLRRSRSVRLNIAFNTALCTGLFRTRYGRNEDTHEDSEEGAI